MADEDFLAGLVGESDAQTDGNANPNSKWQNVSIIKMAIKRCDMNRSFLKQKKQYISEVLSKI
jgi:hypothetical protein